MTKHTKGPWKVGSDAEFEGQVIGKNVAGPDGFHVARVTTRSDPENRANASLIAAAPELLEALELVVGSLEFDREDELSKEVMRWVDRAIRKAKG